MQTLKIAIFPSSFEMTCKFGLDSVNRSHGRESVSSCVRDRSGRSSAVHGRAFAQSYSPRHVRPRVNTFLGGREGILPMGYLKREKEIFHR